MSEPIELFKLYTWSELDAEDEAENAKYLANAEALDVSPIIEQYRTWAVTEYGVECLNGFYPIRREDVHDSDWPLHMAAKGWVEMYDFLEALEHAKTIWDVRGRPKSPGRPKRERKQPRQPLSVRVRFAVFQRDGNRCTLCGVRPAPENDVVLHVDHIHPHSKGGSSELENLRVLCADCNLGKSDSL